MPIYKGTDSNPIQRVHVGGKDHCMFKGNTLVHPAAIAYNDITSGDWTIPTAMFQGTSYNQIYKTLKYPASPKIYRGGSSVTFDRDGQVIFITILENGYYDIVWRATYVADYSGANERLRLLRYSKNQEHGYYASEATIAQSDSVLVQQTPKDIEVSIRRTYLNSLNAILFVSSTPSSWLKESNATVMINKVP